MEGQTMTDDSGTSVSEDDPVKLETELKNIEVSTVFLF